MRLRAENGQDVSFDAFEPGQQRARTVAVAVKWTAHVWEGVFEKIDGAKNDTRAGSKWFAVGLLLHPGYVARTVATYTTREEAEDHRAKLTAALGNDAVSEALALSQRRAAER